MRAEITIEQFDNGISLKWRDAEDVVVPKAVVTLERDQTRVIGETIWDDIKALMDYKSVNVVKMAIEYLAEEEDPSRSGYWSEEDAFWIKALTGTVKDGGSIRNELRGELVKWLESLRQRIEKQQ
jgi:hypothetical protein